MDLAGTTDALRVPWTTSLMSTPFLRAGRSYRRRSVPRRTEQYNGIFDAGERRIMPTLFEKIRDRHVVTARETGTPSSISIAS